MSSERAGDLLGRERRRIEDALARRRKPPGTERQDQDLADAASDLNEREFEDGLVEQLEDELAALERAEARLAEGTYGISVESGEAIPDDRLEANPLAERTIEEERRLERR